MVKPQKTSMHRFFGKASKISDAFSFGVKNGLEFFWRPSFFGLEFFENVQQTIGFPLFWAVLRPTYGGWLPFAPMIDIPKGFSSKMTLEVAPRGLDIATVKV